MSPQEFPRVPDAELAVLELLWEHGPATIRQLADRLYPGGSASQYATVQKLLERLEAKACVRRDRSQFAHRFEAIVARDDLIGQRLQTVAETLCDGSLTPLLMHLAGAARLTPAQREMLRRMLDEPKKQARSKRPRGEDHR